MIIDQHRAHQKVIMAQLLKQSSEQAVPGRVLLFPQHYVAEAGDFAMITSYQAELKTLGFELELQDSEAIIKVAPAGLPDIEIIPYLEEVLYLMKHDVMTEPQKARQGFMQKLSDKMAVKPGTVLSDEEMQDLMHRLFLLPDAALGVDGKPVLKIMTIGYLANFLS
jgi:DNA mismatch repair ATPase MutL